MDGWRLRAAAGVTKRANSALPLSDALPLEAVVDFYRSRGLPPRVQVSSPEVDAALAGLGWERDFPVVVLTGPAPAGPSTAVVEPAPDADWLACWWSVDGRGGDAELDVLRRCLAAVEAPAAYARVLEDGRTVAVGRAVAQEGHVGVFSMAVLPDARRRGLGRSVLSALSTWGARQGAGSAYLQVLEANAAARTLCAAAGLVPAHRYHYRTLAP